MIFGRDLINLVTEIKRSRYYVHVIKIKVGRDQGLVLHEIFGDARKMKQRRGFFMNVERGAWVSRIRHLTHQAP